MHNIWQDWRNAGSSHQWICVIILHVYIWGFWDLERDTASVPTRNERKSDGRLRGRRGEEENSLEISRILDRLSRVNEWILT